MEKYNNRFLTANKIEMQICGKMYFVRKYPLFSKEL